MSWARILEIIKEEVSDPACERIANKVLKEFGGCRVTITDRRKIDFKEAESVSPGKPKEIARALGVHPSTVYRAIKRGKLFVR